MKIIKRKIKDLIRAEYNPRKINKIQEIDLRESLIRFGLVDPIIINVNKERQNIVIGGHQRIKIWEELGNNDIECNELNLTLDKERELNIRLNKSGGSFDDDLIKEFFEYEELTEWGFTPDELFEPDEKTIDGLIEDDEIPEAKESKVKRGDIWQLGEHRIMCGDSTSSDDVAKLMNGEIAEMIHTDPPYNINYEGGGKKREVIKNDNLSNFNQFLLDAFTMGNENIRKGGAVYVWHASSETHNFIKEFLNAGFLFKSYIVWNKNNSTFGRSDYHWKHEPCLYGWKDGAAHKWFGDRKQTTVWDIDRPSRSEAHPTMKPIDLCTIALKNSSDKNQIILDMFLGSGSTLIAAEKLKRKCYGMELDEKYCDVIIERWEQFTGQKADKING